MRLRLILIFSFISIFAYSQNHRGILADFGAGVTNHAEFNGDLQFGFQKPSAIYYLTAVGSVFTARWHDDKTTHALFGPRFNYSLLKSTSLTGIDIVPFTSLRREWYGNGESRWTSDLGFNIIKYVNTITTQQGGYYLSPRIQFNTQTRFVITLGMRGIL